MSAPKSSTATAAALHPVTLTTFAPTGVELSTWAYITQPRPSDPSDHESYQMLPNLVTAHANSLKIYVVDPMSGTLILASSYDHLAGTVVSLFTLPSAAGQSDGTSLAYDGLLMGFAGHPRLSVVYPPGGISQHSRIHSTPHDWSGVLTASSIIDLTPALTERCLGSVTPLEQDLTATITEDGKIPTVAVILGGGVSIATFQLPRSNRDQYNWWRTATEPYILPLDTLSTHIPFMKSAASSALSGKYNRQMAQSGGGGGGVITMGSNKISHGFGDILSCAFLQGYTEPVLAVLHSNPHLYGGRSTMSRLGHYSSHTRTPMTLTAISISNVQKRSVVLWSCADAMPADAFQIVPHPKGGVLVIGVNEILYVDCAGIIKCCTAVNGWVRSTGSAALIPKHGQMGGIMQPNPSPLPKLSLQLDGCRLSFTNHNVAIMSLRDGSLYSLELHDKEECIGVGRGENDVCMSLAPIGTKLGSAGEICSLSVLPLAHVSVISKIWSKFVTTDNKIKDDPNNKASHRESLSFGLAFAGSRMGDSTLFLYGLKEKVKLIPSENDVEKEKVVAEVIESSASTKRKRGNKYDINEQYSSKKITTTSADLKMDEENRVAAISDDEVNFSEDEILRREEEGLYAISDDEESNIIELFDSPEQETLLPGISSKQLFRPQIKSMSVFESVAVLDSLIGLGPIGPGTIGSTAGKELKGTQSFPIDPTKQSAGKSLECVFPCGFGNSGALAVMTVPGLHCGSTVINEVDCSNMGSIYSCPNFGYFFVLKKNDGIGCTVMKLVTSETGQVQLEEVEINSVVDGDIDESMEGSIPSFDVAKDVLTRMNLIFVKEFSCTRLSKYKSEKFICIFVQYGSAYGTVILSETSEGKLKVYFSHFIGSEDEGVMISRESLASISFLEHLDNSKSPVMFDDLSFACVWSNGCGSIFSISILDGPEKCLIKEVFLENETIEITVGDLEDDDFNNFYCSKSITAMDIFTVSDNILGNEKHMQTKDVVRRNKDSEYMEVDDRFDEDDMDLYGINVASLHKSEMFIDESSSSTLQPSRYNSLGGYISGSHLSQTSRALVAISRQNGELGLYDVSKLFALAPGKVSVHSITSLTSALTWKSSSGCGQGSSTLFSDSEGSSARFSFPKIQESCAVEVRLFFCGPSITGNSIFDDGKDLSILRSLCLVVRTNQGDLHLYNGTKTCDTDTLVFKRIQLRNIHRRSKEETRHHTKLVRKKIVVSDEMNSAFISNQLHRFSAISGEDGLFASTCRPQWFISERGAPISLFHRLRHCAPAGGVNSPVSGFCAGFVMGKNSSTHGFLTIHERIGRVGTQRLTLFNGLSDIFSSHGIFPGGGISIQKIPLGVTVRKIDYIDDPLVSSQSHPIYALLISRETNLDLSLLAYDGLTEEERVAKKEQKEKRQLQKQVEADLGGFEVDQEWVEEIERDNCFEVEKRYGGAPTVPKSSYEIWLLDASSWRILDTFKLEDNEYGMTMKYVTLSDISPEEDKDIEHEDVTFLSIGTAFVDSDGEDVESKGRTLLFELKRTGDQMDSHEIDMNLTYEKEISVGPVTSLTQLSSDGKYRLVIGAGAELTVEQWGMGKLTQVGFFHANMQVLDIVKFKNFLLLSDAYDSVHFLVWRESDKSLTLLAKDYEPVSCYATGIISRGSSLSFVVHDDRQNISFLTYAPLDPAARGGNKLVCRADCHLGTATVGMQNHLCRSSLLVNSATFQSTLAALKQQDPLHGKLDDDQRFGLHYGSTDSCFGSIVPVNESIYWRLAALQSVMSNALESHCSLSHRAWRLYRRTPRRGGCRSNDRKKGVIDGDLVMKFIDLPIIEQEELASAIGSTVDLILDNLLEVGVSSMII